ncbi:MAG TPA: hypothetical protein VGR81_05090 [Candidatus Acidoferrales bacterium]|nr:hypothetical protein [Candidatus Acidoferrales bacterium]
MSATQAQAGPRQILCGGKSAVRNTLLSLLIVFGAAALLAGCENYKARQEMISRGAADVMPYADSDVTLPDGTKMHLTRVAGSNDYTFTAHSDSKTPWNDCDTNDNGTGSGTLRFMHLRDDIYAIQQKCDSENIWTISFFRIQQHDFKELDFTDKDIDKQLDLAKQHNVRIDVADGDIVSSILSGSENDITAFLRDHKQMTFEDAKSKKDDSN